MFSKGAMALRPVGAEWAIHEDENEEDEEDDLTGLDSGRPSRPGTGKIFAVSGRKSLQIVLTSILPDILQSGAI